VADTLLFARARMKQDETEEAEEEAGGLDEEARSRTSPSTERGRWGGLEEGEKGWLRGQ
jgi:hypothetical protein